MADESTEWAARDEARLASETSDTSATSDTSDGGVSHEEDERYRGATPPGYDWPTHGGYLGCLLGVMTAVLLAPLGYIGVGFLGALLAPSLRGFGVALAIIVTVIAYLAVFIGLSRLGWYLGKRFLREYEQSSGPVWGEDDEEDLPPIVDVSTLAPGAEHDATPAVEDEQRASQAK